MNILLKGLVFVLITKYNVESHIEPDRNNKKYGATLTVIQEINVAGVKSLFEQLVVRCIYLVIH